MSAAETPGEGSIQHLGKVFLLFAIVPMAGKIGNMVGRFGQPAIIGDLLAGILSTVFSYMGWSLKDEIAANDSIAFLSSFGALLLLFSIGLESNLAEMRRVGPKLVAIIGVVTPSSGRETLPIFFGDESSNARLVPGPRWSPRGLASPHRYPAPSGSSGPARPKPCSA